MEPGTYILIIELEQPTRTHVGTLGRICLPAGWYGYVGSAFGPGGLGRVNRHLEVARGERRVRQWHIDSLLLIEAASISGTYRLFHQPIECAIGRTIGAHGIDGFGATDCSCGTHLAYRPDFTSICDWAERSIRQALDPVGEPEIE